MLSARAFPEVKKENMKLRQKNMRKITAALAIVCAMMCTKASAKELGVIASYEDDSISVQVEQHYICFTNVYVARVRIADASQLRVAAAYGFDRDQTAPAVDIARREGAIVAINGDYFSYQQAGYMIRDGVRYRSEPMEGRDILLIDENGDFFIEKSATKESIAAYESMNIRQSFNFGPGLIVDGEVLGPYYAKYNAAQKPRQRSCIAQVARGEREYLLISCEGPVESEDGGLTMAQFAEFVADFGVQNAYNLDGGDSTALIFDGEKLNAVNNKSHRPISDIIYFASGGE